MVMERYPKGSELGLTISNLLITSGDRLDNRAIQKRIIFN